MNNRIVIFHYLWAKAQKDPLVDMLTNIPVAPKTPKKEDTPPSTKKSP